MCWDGWRAPTRGSCAERSLCAPTTSWRLCSGPDWSRRVTLRFVAEGDEDPAALRNAVDLDIGVLAPQPPEVHTEHLLTDELVGVVHSGHPLTRGRVDVDRFASVPQVTVSRRGRAHGPVDDLLAARGHHRRVALTVPSFTVAALTALSGDLLALLPRSFAQSFTRTVPLQVVEIPLPLPALEIGLAWHARLHLDGGHMWLRGAVRSAARGQGRNRYDVPATR